MKPITNRTIVVMTIIWVLITINFNIVLYYNLRPPVTGSVAGTVSVNILPGTAFVNIAAPEDPGFYDTNSSFNTSVNITSVSGLVYGCNATITFSNSSILTLIADPATRTIGNLSRGESTLKSWQVFTTSTTGESNLTVTTSCETGLAHSDTITILVGFAYVTAPEDFTARLNIDNQSVDLNWSSIPSATYDIYYDSDLNVTENIDPDSDSPQVTNINTNNWTDQNASTVQQRYYRVVAVRLSAKNMSDKIMGKFDISFISNSPKTISLPLVPVNLSIDNIIRPAGPDRLNKPDIISAFSGNNLIKQARWYGPSYPQWYSFTTPKLTELELNIGYYLYPINTSYNSTVVGEVLLNGTINLSFIQNSPLSFGIPSPKYFNLTTIYPPGNFTTPKDFIRMFYGDNQQKYSEWYGTDSGIPYSWQSFSSPTLIYLEPGVGYYYYPVNLSFNDSINLNEGEVI